MLRASPAIIAKVAIEKVQLSTLAIFFFFILSNRFSILLFIYFLNIILCGRKCKRNRERVCVKGEREERENNNNK